MTWTIQDLAATHHGSRLEAILANGDHRLHVWLSAGELASLGKVGQDLYDGKARPAIDSSTKGATISGGRP